MPSSGANRLVFWWVLGAVVAADVLTKALAVAKLSRIPLPIVGDVVTFQLVRNTGAAFGINVGTHSRWVFTGLALLALVVLGAMVAQTEPGRRVRLVALGLVCGGAVGNLIDRLRSSLGVVDFIDVGVGLLRWPTFNVADVAVSCGAVLLAVVLWMEGRDEAGERVPQRDPAEASP